MKDCPLAIDATAWVGSYPFRGLAKKSPRHLDQWLEHCNVELAIVSPFDALFWENNLEAFAAWVPELATYPRLEPWPVVNPAMPGQIAALERLVAEHQPRGLRLLPNYHNYRLGDSCVNELMGFAREQAMRVQVFQRIADERWHWMLHVPAVAEEDLVAFVARYPAVSILVSGMANPAPLAGPMSEHPSLYADLSWVKGGIFVTERLVNEISADRLIFGSLWPLQVPEATLWQVLDAEISDRARAAILRGNAATWLGRTAVNEESYAAPPGVRGSLRPI